MDGFEKEMEKQKERARASQKFDVSKVSGKIEMRSNLKKSEFTGYHTLKDKSYILDIFVDNRSVDSVEAGQKAAIILDVTPFYGEMGGQVGDTGILRGGEAVFKVGNTVHFGDFVLHQGQWKADDLRSAVRSRLK
jgi:alanyl-tRNA synthetase